jgi:hypothetical protein
MARGTPAEADAEPQRRFAMSVLDRFITDYEERSIPLETDRTDEGPQIAHRGKNGARAMGQHNRAVAAHAKKELEQIERLLSEAKTKTKIE